MPLKVKTSLLKLLCAVLIVISESFGDLVLDLSTSNVDSDSTVGVSPNDTGMRKYMHIAQISFAVPKSRYLGSFSGSVNVFRCY